jgi:methyl coenzyme M reductase subunit C-like uncharacterized protein (methanogenesis marker protein 7)
MFTTHKQQRKKVALQNAHRSQIVEKKKKLHCEGTHTCVIFCSFTKCTKKKKTHTTRDARIFGDDGIVSVIVEMRRNKNKGNEILMM